MAAIVASWNGVSKTQTLQLTPSATASKPVISSFTATPASINSGGTSTLSWSVSGATSLSINQGVGTVTGATSENVTPTATTTYTLTATNTAGSTTATATVTVKAAASKPVISSFTATPASINSGGTSTLSWSVSGATSLSINQGVGTVTGATSENVTPTATTTYTLTATNTAGSTTATATVTVKAAAPEPDEGQSGAAGLVGFWKLNETSGTVAMDASGNGNSGALINNPQWTAGKVGNALQFNGNNYVSVPSSPGLEINGNAISFGAWYYHTSTTNGFILGKTVSDYTYMMSVEKGSQQFQVQLVTGGTRRILGVPSQSKPGELTKYNNTWVHLFVVYNGSTIKVYVNGAEQLSQAASGAVRSNTNAFAIGARGGDGSWTRFNSKIDEVRVYNRALTAQEVSAIYEGTDTGAPASPVISSFKASPASITSGASSTLSWSVSGATSLSINQGVGTVTGTTSKSVKPTATTTYTLTATNAAGSVTKTATVTVSAAPPPPEPPVISSFKASPASITSGASSTLSWSVSGATSLSINQGVGTVTGTTSKSVKPTATTTYTLTATNAAGSVTKTATVTVSAAQPPSGSTITVYPAITYQTMVGWEATDQSGQTECSGFNSYKSTLLNQAVNDLGINRIRLEVRAKSDGWTFDLADLDSRINQIILPIRQHLSNRGEKLFLNVCFVGDSNLHTDKNRYAQQVLATYNHLKTTFGFVPDGWEVVLEPTWISEWWTPYQLADAIVATGNLLKSNGYTPYLIGPSTPGGASNALSWFDTLTQNSNVFPHLKEFSYHRYAETDSYLATIAARGKQFNVNTSQLEHIGADYHELHNDLKRGNVSAWQQFTLAYCTSDNGAQYYVVNGGSISMGSRTKFLRQYFKFIRSGAVRVDAQTGNSKFDPVAFKNTNGKFVVVVKATGSGSFNVTGLPAGSYGIKYTTDSAYDVDLADVSITSGGAVNASIPGAGVLTVYQK
ncbi:MAG: LamG domain-containing protein [Bryobacterales bacterium]|nr:LamG domain-containing protein [Bryobacterales bacterium]